METIRHDILAREEAVLSPLACLSQESRGRREEESPDPLRTDFMRDRDRIIHSKAFRRLKHKTQVYISPGNDHYRTRLTHTLEVTQIAKTVGRALALNEDLIEAIGLAHDVGHTPFAHCGEEVLNQLLDGGFRHAENSVRVLTRIEKRGSGRGLNLTEEVLDGVLYHSGFTRRQPHARSFEGQVVRFCDKIAYVQHDIDDSIRAGLLREEDLPEAYTSVLGQGLSARITTLVNDLVAQGQALMQAEDPDPTLTFSPPVFDAMAGLRRFLFKEIYHGEVCQQERERAAFVVEYLFKYYMKRPEKMPHFYQDLAKKDGKARGVADYISGMTDNFCVATFKDLTVPRSYISMEGDLEGF